MEMIRPGHKQRLLGALDHRFTGEVPFFEAYIADRIVDRVMGRPMGGKHMLQLDPPDYVEFLQCTGMDAGYLYTPWPVGRKNQVDQQGRVYYVDGTIKSRADFDQIRPLSLDLIPRKIESFVAAGEGTDLGRIFALHTPPTLAATAIGPTDHLLAMMQTVCSYSHGK